jgi:hypothetical protein
MEICLLLLIFITLPHYYFEVIYLYFLTKVNLKIKSETKTFKPYQPPSSLRIADFQFRNSKFQIRNWFLVYALCILTPET